MPDRGLIADGLRPARVFALGFALGAVGFLIAAVGIGLTALSIEPTVLARGAAGSLTLPDLGTAPRFTVYGASSSGTRPEDTRCDLESESRTFVASSMTGGTTTFDGRTLYRFGTVSDVWQGGDVVSCTGAAELVATTEGRGRRLLIAAAFLVVAIVAAVFARIGYWSRTAHRAGPGGPR